MFLWCSEPTFGLLPSIFWLLSLKRNNVSASNLRVHDESFVSASESSTKPFASLLNASLSNSAAGIVAWFKIEKEVSLIASSSLTSFYVVEPKNRFTKPQRYQSWAHCSVGLLCLCQEISRMKKGLPLNNIYGMH